MVDLEGADRKRSPPMAQDGFDRVWLVGLTLIFSVSQSFLVSFYKNLLQHALLSVRVNQLQFKKCVNFYFFPGPRFKLTHNKFRKYNFVISLNDFIFKPIFSAIFITCWLLFVIK